jgi:hypothetical protein
MTAADEIPESRFMPAILDGSHKTGGKAFANGMPLGGRNGSERLNYLGIELRSAA